MKSPTNPVWKFRCPLCERVIVQGTGEPPPPVAIAEYQTIHERLAQSGAYSSTIQEKHNG